MPFSKSRLDPAFINRPLAHRGLHDIKEGRVENSRAAFIAAMTAGYGIELDVQPSLENTPMVFHDYDLARLTGRAGLLAQARYNDLIKTKLTNSVERIAGLGAIMELIGGQTPLLIEVKDQDGALGANIGAVVENIAILADDYAKSFGYGTIALMSFNPYVVQALRRFSERLALGLVTDNFLANPEWRRVPRSRAARLTAQREIDGLDIDFISHNVSFLDELPIGAARPALPVLCWTVKSEVVERAARRVADNITFENYLPKPV